LGYQPDLKFLNAEGISLGGTRPGVDFAGVIVAGRYTNEIFIENGHFDGRWIAGSHGPAACRTAPRWNAFPQPPAPNVWIRTGWLKPGTPPMNPYWWSCQMLNSFMNLFFGCSHERTTFPITPKRGVPVGSDSLPVTRTGMYVACLDCGQELAYDWKSMRVGEVLKAPAAPSQEPVEVQPVFRMANTLLTALIRR
jgi:hypothetical protein